jgi:hypothetical protein
VRPCRKIYTVRAVTMRGGNPNQQQAPLRMTSNESDQTSYSRWSRSQSNYISTQVKNHSNYYDAQEFNKRWLIHHNVTPAGALLLASYLMDDTMCSPLLPRGTSLMLCSNNTAHTSMFNCFSSSSFELSVHNMGRRLNLPVTQSLLC